MKKYLILIYLILLICLSGCFDYKEINSYYYASSMGLTYNKEEKTYKVTLYILNTLHMSNDTSTKSDTNSLAYIATYQDKSILNCLHQIFQNSDISIDLRHLRSILMEKNFINSENLKNFFDFIINDVNCYFNFAVYVCNDNDLENIYMVNNFTETSAYNTLLTNANNYSNYKIPYCNDLINDYYSITENNKYPVVLYKKDVFNHNDQNYNTIYFGGYCSLDEDNNAVFYTEDQYPAVIFLNNRTNFEISLIENNLFYNISTYKIEYLFKDETFYINIDINGFCLNSDDGEGKLKEYFIKLFDELIKITKINKTDLFNINHYSKIKKSSLDYQTTPIKYQFNIKLL